MPVCPYCLHWNFDGVSTPPPGPDLPPFFCKLGLVFEGVHARYGAFHEQEDDALGSGCEVRLLGSQRFGFSAKLAPFARLAEQSGQSKIARIRRPRTAKARAAR